MNYEIDNEKTRTAEREGGAKRDRIFGFKTHPFPLPRAVAPGLNCELPSHVDSARANAVTYAHASSQQHRFGGTARAE
jgi:hypothetical protein